MTNIQKIGDRLPREKDPVLFLAGLFKIIAGTHVCRDAETIDIESYSGAIAMLREATGFTRDRLARYIGITSGQLIGIEIRGRPKRSADLSRLKCLAEEHELEKLAEYFDLQQLKISYASKPLRKGYGAFKNQNTE